MSRKLSIVCVISEGSANSSTLPTFRPPANTLFLNSNFNFFISNSQTTSLGAMRYNFSPDDSAVSFLTISHIPKSRLKNSSTDRLASSVIGLDESSNITNPTTNPISLPKSRFLYEYSCIILSIAFILVIFSLSFFCLFVITKLGYASPFQVIKIKKPHWKVRLVILVYSKIIDSLFLSNYREYLYATLRDAFSLIYSHYLCSQPLYRA